MHNDFKVGDQVRVTKRYMGEEKTDEVGTVVLIRQRHDTAHPYGVSFKKVTPTRHDLYCSKYQADENNWPILKDVFFVDSDTWYRLHQRTGYYFPANCLELVEVKYDPNQQGDTDEDI